MASPLGIVVEHATAWPGDDCLVAGEIAGLLRGVGAHSGRQRFVRLRDPHRRVPGMEWAEHVTVQGALVANGLVWVERALGQPLDGLPEEAIDAATPAGDSVIVAFNPHLFPGVAVADLRRAVGRRFQHAAWLHVSGADASLVLTLTSPRGVTIGPIGPWSRDAFGRLGVPPAELTGWLAAECGLASAPEPVAPGGADPLGRPPPLLSSSAPVLVLGESNYLRSVYPALLAALGDAADSVDPAIRVTLVSPRGLSHTGWRELLSAAAGVVLPGGSDLSQVEGQMGAATAALALEVPTLGICLGMQSMVTAAARTSVALVGADLEEVNPRASVLLFQRLKGPDGRPRHRLGLRAVRLDVGSRLAAAYRRTEITERFNHRYHLDPERRLPLEAAGIRVTACSTDDGIVDGIEHATHSCYIGLQGHPELSSRRGTAHPLLRAFLEHAARQRRRRE